MASVAKPFAWQEPALEVVSSRCGRGVQSQGFWVMGFFGAIGDLEELFTHNFIIGLLSLESIPGLLPTPSVQLFWKYSIWPSCKGWLAGCGTSIGDEDDTDFLGFFWRVEALSRGKAQGWAQTSLKFMLNYEMKCTWKEHQLNDGELFFLLCMLLCTIVCETSKEFSNNTLIILFNYQLFWVIKIYTQ